MNEKLKLQSPKVTDLPLLDNQELFFFNFKSKVAKQGLFAL